MKIYFYIIVRNNRVPEIENDKMTNDINDRKQTLLLSTVVAIFSMSIILSLKMLKKH